MLKEFFDFAAIRSSGRVDAPPAELDTVAFARTQLHFRPDPIQAQVLDPNIRRGILNCCRQWGKSTTLAVKAVHHAFTHPKSLTICISPCGRQSTAFIDKYRDFCRTLNLPIRAASEYRMSISMPNGARIIGLPGRDDTTRGFSAVSLLLVDEASRVAEDIISAVTPMLIAAPNASFWLLSTLNGCDNYFYRVWSDHDTHQNWTRIQVTAPECPRISASRSAPITPRSAARSIADNAFGAADHPTRAVHAARRYGVLGGPGGLRRLRLQSGQRPLAFQADHRRRGLLPVLTLCHRAARGTGRVRPSSASAIFSNVRSARLPS
ncbi:MAG: terminase family protein [Bryobacterales bacterium]|nr:terminase family protein [Bryobacterales bacterium]